jgi:hypothetical protein
MAFASPPVSTGRGRRGEVTGADPSASSGGGFRRVRFLFSRSMRSTNDWPGNDNGEPVCDLSHSEATIMAATPAPMPDGPNDSPSAWMMASDARVNRHWRQPKMLKVDSTRDFLPLRRPIWMCRGSGS